MARKLSPFSTIESAQQFNEIFETAVGETLVDVQEDISAAQGKQDSRRLEALLLVQHKLDKLSDHIRRTRRILNDLKMLGRVLVEERNYPQKP